MTVSDTNAALMDVMIDRQIKYSAAKEKKMDLSDIFFDNFPFKVKNNRPIQIFDELLTRIVCYTGGNTGRIRFSAPDHKFVAMEFLYSGDKICTFGLLNDYEASKRLSTEQIKNLRRINLETFRQLSIQAKALE